MTALEIRKRIASELPWVTRLKVPRCCDGKNGTCKFRGYWKFRALKVSYAKDGTYCWSHLIYNGLNYDMAETARINKWIDQHYPNGIVC